MGGGGGGGGGTIYIQYSTSIKSITEENWMMEMYTGIYCINLKILNVHYIEVIIL